MFIAKTINYSVLLLQKDVQNKQQLHKNKTSKNNISFPKTGILFEANIKFNNFKDDFNVQAQSK